MKTLKSFAILGAYLLVLGCAGSLHIESWPQPSPPSHPSRDTTAGNERHPGHPARLDIPPGHLPPPGQCRVWIPGQPPGHQSPPGPCAALRADVPPGAWLLFRPSDDRRYVEVSIYHRERPRSVVAVHTYEADSGRYVR